MAGTARPTEAKDANPPHGQTSLPVPPRRGRVWHFESCAVYGSVGAWSGFAWAWRLGGGMGDWNHEGVLWRVRECVLIWGTGLKR